MSQDLTYITACYAGHLSASSSSRLILMVCAAMIEQVAAFLWLGQAFTGSWTCA
jgi:hypothetical protein